MTKHLRTIVAEHAQGIDCHTCGNCAGAFEIDAASLARCRFGATLELRLPAFVRVCATHSSPHATQLVNTWWTCRQWRPLR